MRAHDTFVIFSAVYQHPYLDLPAKLKAILEELITLMIKELQESQPDMAILSRYLFILLQYLRSCRLRETLLLKQRKYTHNKKKATTVKPENTLIQTM